MVNSFKSKLGKNIMLHRTYTANAALSDTEYLPPTQFKLSTNSAVLTESSTDVANPIPISNGILNDDGSNTFTGTTAGSNSTDNLVTFKEGAGVLDYVAQNLIKDDSSVTATWTIANLATAGTIITGTKYTGNWIYIKDTAALLKFATSGTCLEFKYGIDTSNYYSYSLEASDLAVGWNWINPYPLLVNELTETGTVTGDIDYFIIEATTNNATDEFIAGDLVYDLLRTFDFADTVKDFVISYPSLDYTTNEATTRSYINSLEGNGFLIDTIIQVNEDTTPKLDGADQYDDESKSSTDEIAFVTVDRIL